MKKLKKVLLPLYKIFKYQEYFKKNFKWLKLNEMVWCFFNGFFLKNFILYDLRKNDSQFYISDYNENFKISSINKNAKILNNKLLFTEVISSHVSMSAIKGLIESGTWLNYNSSACHSVQELLTYVKEKGAIILKPIDGDGGEGIVKISNIAGQLYWNQEKKNDQEVIRLMGKLDHYFVSDLVYQHNYSASIFPKSINTIRLLTMINPTSKEPFIAAAAHRIGNNQSFPVDNCAKGGYTAEINIETGVIGKAVKTYFDGDRPTWYSDHPDTGSHIEGVIIPQWEYIKGKALELAKVFSFVPYIGWDIVLQPDETITILEANDGPDLKLHQVHNPLLKSDQVRLFYKYHQII